MKRRKFIKNSLVLSGGILTSSPLNIFCADTSNSNRARVVISRSSSLTHADRNINTGKLIKLLDNGMMAFFDKNTIEEAWRCVVRKEEVIGIKVNCLSGKYGGTHPVLVDAISERLMQLGVRSENIIIWDRSNEDLEEGGYNIAYKGNRIKCFGNEIVGFTSDFEIFGSAASLVTKTITQFCDAVINVPVMKDHGIAGITMSLKNMFGAIHNPNKYHQNVGDPFIPDVYMLPSIRKKIRFTICDAIRGQYEGGPSYMPQWSWPYNGLIMGTDPVAIDYTGWQIIEEQRLLKGIKSLKATGREPTYIATAADSDHNLGINDPERIDIINI